MSRKIHAQQFFLRISDFFGVAQPKNPSENHVCTVIEGAELARKKKKS
jgi:hypothetical protein